MTSAAVFLAGPSVDHFLLVHWRKKPLFLPAALPDFRSPLSPDELAALACDERVESRLVTHTRDRDRDGKRVERPYRLLHGPFSEDSFGKLGDEAWTLLVQDVDKFVPEVHTLLDLVSFLPRWSVDDIMISYAAPGGSVGPHTDRYDVFLLQAQGSRRWQISTKCDEANLRSDTELKVLSDFEPEEEFVARPGDVLYLPPGVAHWGVAEDACMTYSFGFRAPTEAALVSFFGDEMLALAGEAQLTERTGAPPASPARLSPALLRSAREMVQRRFDQVMKSERTLGRYLTMPKPHFETEPVESEWTEERVRRALADGTPWTRNIASRFLYAEANGEIVLFVDGQDHSLGSGARARGIAVDLCEGSPTDAATAAAEGNDTAALRAIASLLSQGSLVAGG